MFVPKVATALHGLGRVDIEHLVGAKERCIVKEKERALDVSI